MIIDPAELTDAQLFHGACVVCDAPHNESFQFLKNAPGWDEPLYACPKHSRK